MVKQKKLNVAVVGGGWAGMSVGADLADNKVPVTIFEASKTLGGRARAVDTSEAILDNGLHILIGAYKKTLSKIKQVSEESQKIEVLRLPLNLEIHPNFSYRASSLFYPLNLMIGLLNAKGLNTIDKLSAFFFIFLIPLLHKKKSISEKTVSQLLHQFYQSHNVKKYIWEPICLAALNTPSNIASARVFLSVLRESLFQGARSSDLLLPSNDLSNIFPNKAKAFIEKNGGLVLTSTRVTSIEITDRGFIINDGRTNAYTHLILAVAPNHLPSLVRSLPSIKKIIKKVENFEYQPIVSVYLQYPKETTLPKPMIGVEDSVCQWVFDRGTLLGQAGLIGVVISGPGKHETSDNKSLAMAVHRTLEREFGFPNFLWHRVIREKKATLKSSPDRQDIGNDTDQENVFLAGDYTESEYPSTIEAAVRSGEKCAKLILKNERF